MMNQIENVSHFERENEAKIAGGIEEYQDMPDTFEDIHEGSQEMPAASPPVSGSSSQLKCGRGEINLRQLPVGDMPLGMPAASPPGSQTHGP